MALGQKTRDAVFFQRARREDARDLITPVAYNPHGGDMAERARQILDRMERDKTWDGSGMMEPDSKSGPQD